MHRLVCIGDSLTQGFKSGAIFETNLSYPAIIAWEMGIPDGDFRYPSFAGAGGLPINLEYLLRRLDFTYGRDLNWLETPLAAISLREWMDDTEDYWERGPGRERLAYSGHYHNLAVWGFEIQDSYQVTADMCSKKLDAPTDNWINQVPEHAMFRTALRVLNPSHSPSANDKTATQVSRTAELAKDGGIENLIVMLGPNNILGTVTSLEFKESTAADARQKDPSKRSATIYKPQHFETFLATLMSRVEQMETDAGSRIDNVFWGNTPSVTIPPVTNGVGGRLSSNLGKVSPYGQSDDPEWYRRYFRFYTRPWVTDAAFNPADDANLPGKTIIEIDRTTLVYNQILKQRIHRHNQAREQAGKQKNWYLVDVHGLLERVAFRRYQEDPSVPPPPEWTPYDFPPSYKTRGLDTRFLRAREGERVQGGLFSLDGIHATTAGYGLVAQEFVNKMQEANVEFRWGDNQTPRTQPIQVDVERLLKLDSLVSQLPQTLDDVWDLLVDGDQILDAFKRAIRALL